MKKLAVCSLLFFLGMYAHAQYSYKAVLCLNKNAQAIEGIIVLISQNQQSISDENGLVSFSNLKEGSLTVSIRSLDYKPISKIVNIPFNGIDTIFLQPRNATLNEVVIAAPADDMQRLKLRGIENTAIYEGKKTELIELKNLVANTATNNARQLYARVPGLNIWENDGAGLQLSIGARGLDPNRTANFNVRQNGYDISADALGYPESYYTPPAEALEQIQVVRGAASLQYGTQFGGLLNFILKKPNENRVLELNFRQSIGSFNFLNTFLSASGTRKNSAYYAFYQRKSGDGWRPNSAFNQQCAFLSYHYKFKNTRFLAEITHMDYLAHQPGGLSDNQFAINPRQSNRTRNWFSTNWNLFSLQATHRHDNQWEWNMRLFALAASRNSIGFRPNRVETDDDGSERDLIKGQFKNLGLEMRYLQRFELFKVPSALLLGMRSYLGNNNEQQGLGSTGSDAQFNFIAPDSLITSSYTFPNLNQSFFAEQVFYLTERFSLTPGMRYEFIQTTAKGRYGSISRDLSNAIIGVSRNEEYRIFPRHIIIAGLGASWKQENSTEWYANLSQNYRSITFADMRINNPSFAIDPNLEDEKGYTFDLGWRSSGKKSIQFDASVFALVYNNRIGEVLSSDAFNRVIRYRTNIGNALIAGFESYAESDLLPLMAGKSTNNKAIVFANLAYIKSQYLSSRQNGIAGNEVEFVPQVTAKGGLRLQIRRWRFSYQVSHTGNQFTDATNAVKGGAQAIFGLIPAYSVHDMSASLEWKRFKTEISLNNLLNRIYFTRRATGYPGPGILPSDGRSIYFTLQVKI